MKYICKNINDISDLELYAFYFKMSKQEQNKINKLVNTIRKKQTIIGRILLNELLIENYNINYFDIELIFNGNAKPYIKDKNIFFNISHSNDYVVCCISDKEIGIDIEKVKNINLKEIKQYATDKESKWINGNKKCAFQIYTLKEAYFKMNGDNLNMIKEIEFNIGSSITCNDKHTKIYLIDNIKDYMGAICEKI